MISAISNYFRTLTERFGQGWNAFWFSPGDAAPLAALRCLVGLAATWWLLTYTPDLERFFGPQGLFPAEIVRQMRPGPAFSVLDYAGNSASLWCLHVASLVILGLFTVGLFTRVTAVLSFLVVLSYIWRAPNLASETEDILAMLLFYLSLAPCGAALSLDAWLARRRSLPGTSPNPLRWSATLALRLLQVHLSVIYAVMALSKLRGVVWLTGDGVWWMGARPESRLIDMTWLHAWPDLIAAWTHAIVGFELIFAVLIWNRTARPLLLAWSLVHWTGLALLTGNVLFCLLMAGAGLAFVSPSVLRKLFGDRASAGA